MGKCANCNSPANKHDKFCKKCGEPLVYVEEYFCDNCGSEASITEKFCKRCGVPLDFSKKVNVKEVVKPEPKKETPKAKEPAFTVAKPIDTDEEAPPSVVERAKVFYKKWSLAIETFKKDQERGRREIKASQELKKETPEERAKREAEEALTAERERYEAEEKRIALLEKKAEEDRLRLEREKAMEAERQKRAIEKAEEDRIKALEREEQAKIRAMEREEQAKIREAQRIEREKQREIERIEKEQEREAKRIESAKQHAIENKRREEERVKREEERLRLQKEREKRKKEERLRREAKRKEKAVERANARYKIVEDKKMTKEDKQEARKLAMSDTQRLSFNLEESVLSSRKQLNQEDYRQVAPQEVINGVKTESKTKEKRSFHISIPTVLLVLLVIGLGVGTAYMINNVGKDLIVKENLAGDSASAFAAAMKAKDSDKLAGMLVSSDGKVEINQGTLAPFIEKLKMDEAYVDKIISYITEDAQKLDAGETLGSERFVKLRKEGTAYKVAIDSVQMIYVVPEGVSVAVDDTVRKDDNFTDTKAFLPGRYKVTFADSEFTFSQLFDVTDDSQRYSQNAMTITYDDLNFNQTIAQFTVEPGEKKIEIRTVGNVPSGVVLVNNLNTGLTIDQFNAIETKNVPEGSTIRIVVKTDRGFRASPTHVLGWESWVRLHIVE